ncbi:hypothetical protein ECC02_007617 [Trypanosoma cruzi]|uniref:Uncharacterized protein n=1 Tax=Trypanosoma cruzi TaxID=5693 RepID=A0A7J6XY83_TRYCR|nr:hypothetical protein ECC02_007617 [Trypanosoma cruzi]
MAGNFGAALWMDEGLFAPCGWCGGCSLRVRCVVAAGFCHFPLAVEMSWMETVVDIFSSCMVGGCWRCVPSLRGCRLVVCELCGWACCLLMLSALSRCILGAPSIFLLLHSFSFCLTDQLTDSSNSSTSGDDDCGDDDGDGAVRCAPCCSLHSRAAVGSSGDVSGDVDAAVVPVDVSCAPSDGSLSYRVRVCVCGRGRSVLLPVLRLSMRIILSVALVCTCMAGMVSWVLCAMWPMRCTHVATVLPAVQRKRKGPPLPSR